MARLHLTILHLFFQIAFKALNLKKYCLWDKALYVGHFILYTLNLVVQPLEAIVQVILLPTMDYKCIGYEFYRFLST